MHIGQLTVFTTGIEAYCHYASVQQS